jgi:hypothetical protein
MLLVAEAGAAGFADSRFAQTNMATAAMSAQIQIVSLPGRD